MKMKTAQATTIILFLLVVATGLYWLIAKYDPVKNYLVTVDVVDGDNTEDRDIPILSGDHEYLTQGLTALDSIRRKPFFYIKKGIDHLSGHRDTVTTIDTVYVKKKGGGSWTKEGITSKFKRQSKNTRSKAERVLDFIEKYKDEAKRQEKLYGIPASIKLAQALLESNVGQSYLAKEANNFFGKKCVCKEKWQEKKDKKTGKISKKLISRTFSHSSWATGCLQKTDDNVWDRFETYSSLAKSWEAYSRLLRGKRYKALFQYTDPNKVYEIPKKWRPFVGGLEKGTRDILWAAGLKARGYATDKKYALKLLGIIDTYEL